MVANDYSLDPTRVERAVHPRPDNQQGTLPSGLCTIMVSIGIQEGKMEANI